MILKNYQLFKINITMHLTKLLHSNLSDDMRIFVIVVNNCHQTWEKFTQPVSH